MSSSLGAAGVFSGIHARRMPGFAEYEKPNITSPCSNVDEGNPACCAFSTTQGATQENRSSKRVKTALWHRVQKRHPPSVKASSPGLCARTKLSPMETCPAASFGHVPLKFGSPSQKRPKHFPQNRQFFWLKASSGKPCDRTKLIPMALCPARSLGQTPVVGACPFQKRPPHLLQKRHCC